ncbi:kynureninase [Eisenibacter elegans]|uniref:kynureninase n=1 Tax=Eisenibacter elegans TaxID=997 RepID=UPI000424C5A2
MMTNLTTPPHTFENSLAFAQQADAQDPLRPMRERYHFPQSTEGRPVLYYTGNSLGLQPKQTAAYVQEVLHKWASQGVEGHFVGDTRWYDYHHALKPAAARIVGALPEEVTLMNTLTVNLHLLMVSFYRPSPTRYKIMMEAGAFPSDQYAVESQVRHHGYSPDAAIVELSPRPGEHTLRPEDILQAIQAEGDSLALVMLGGVNYYTGQLFDMQAITKAAHQVGAVVGFDLAHAAGNVALSLHDWDVDFAAWCTYKYLNSSPGGVSGVFIHQRHAQNTELHRFAGWWGYDDKTRFEMKKGFKAIPNADGWQLSNGQILTLAAHKAALQLFDEVGMEALIAKSRQLTAYLEFVIKEAAADQPDALTIITPADPQARGCQLSILTDHRGKQLFDYLHQHGVIPDWREPNVIRFAPVPMYNSFEEVYQLGQLLSQALKLY